MTDWEKVCMCQVPHDQSCWHTENNRRLAGLRERTGGSEAEALE